MREIIGSIFIGEKHLWGRGYGTKSIQLITNFGFQTLNLNKLKASCYAQNIASARAFEKCGYEREGLLREHIISCGQSIDVIILGLRAKEYWNRFKQEKEP